jgi:hypothetical protein
MLQHRPLSANKPNHFIYHSLCALPGCASGPRQQPNVKRSRGDGVPHGPESSLKNLTILILVLTPNCHLDSVPRFLNCQAVPCLYLFLNELHPPSAPSIQRKRDPTFQSNTALRLCFARLTNYLRNRELGSHFPQ